ncbi:MAG TPA: hypothetical protein VFW75_03690 [Acetobacteraceae bacterium]|nr:hypothetical protein [Acetobacteraceae bacterium]
MRLSLPLALAATCLTLTGLTLTGVRAAQRCPEQPVFDIEALKSEMMVLATACHDDAQYNAFIRRYQPSLVANEKALDAYFRRTYGRRGQAEHDSFVTSLANAQSDAGLKQGTDFCPRNAVLFEEAMALDAEHELPQFAAGKDLIPASLDTCQPPAPVRAPARTTRKARR